VQYLSASAVMIHYEEVLHQVYGPLPLPLTEPATVGAVRVLLWQLWYRVHITGFETKSMLSRATIPVEPLRQLWTTYD